MLRSSPTPRAPAASTPRALRASESPAAAVLAELSGGADVSGHALAQRLGITRAAVWKQIEQLRGAGLRVHALAGRGYRLDAPVEPLDAGRIRAAIPEPLRARVAAIDVFWRIDSTSSELMRRRSEPASPEACLAEIQTAGRGRHGRAWHTPLGGGLALSFRRRFATGMAGLAGLSLVAGLAVLDALDDVGIAGVRLKWPNDVVAGGRKLAGVLVEIAGDALGPCDVVAGIGLNLRVDAEEAAIDQPWIDVATLAGGAVPSRNRIAARVLARLAEAFERFANSGFAPFAEEYARHDALAGNPVRVLGGASEWSGVAIGVNAQGALRVSRDGDEVLVDSGEVSVRSAGGAPRRREEAPGIENRRDAADRAASRRRIRCGS